MKVPPFVFRFPPHDAWRAYSAAVPRPAAASKSCGHKPNNAAVSRHAPPGPRTIGFALPAEAEPPRSIPSDNARRFHPPRPKRFADGRRKFVRPTLSVFDEYPLYLRNGKNEYAMVLQILIIISIALQLVAAVVAIRLTRVTKYNVAWLLFTLGLVLMCMIRLNQYVYVVGGQQWRLPPHFMAWIGVVTSLCFAIGMFYIGKIINTTRRLNYQRKLTERRILNTVLRTEEKERLNFSKELHDGLGPLLSSARMSLGELARNCRSEQDAELITNTTYVIDEAIRSIREISNKLSPHTLSAFGLSRAVSNFVNKTISVNPNRKVEIRFDTNLKTERFDPNVEVILYRVIGELINNSMKHSGATLITLGMTYADDIIAIDYTDNGKGFDTAAVLDTGMGLSNITSRVQSLKGTVEIKSERGKGMSARITVNVAHSDEREKKL